MPSSTSRASRLIGLIRRLRAPPLVLVNGSAIGWYGLREDEELDERADGRDCFSHLVCLRWEGAALDAVSLGVRVVRLRIGLVLASEGGLLSRMFPPFELGLGGPFGKGRHWMSWIHRDDLVRMIIHAMVTPSISGPLNGTAPTPVRNARFCSALAGALARPAILPVPAWPLRLLLGDFARELLLGGQKVLPRAVLESGFRFHYATIESALDAIVGRTSRAE